MVTAIVVHYENLVHLVGRHLRLPGLVFLSHLCISQLLLLSLECRCWSEGELEGEIAAVLLSTHCHMDSGWSVAISVRLGVTV